MPASKKNNTSFKPGTSGNPTGRPKGALTKKRQFWEEIEKKFLNDGAEKFWRELYKLKGRAYVDYYLRTMEYFLPKLGRIEQISKEETKVIVEIKKSLLGAKAITEATTVLESLPEATSEE